MPISIRHPSPFTLKSTTTPPATTASPPTYDFLSGTWHVTYTTLPLWKGKQNVRITYKAVSSPNDASHMPDLDDHVEYQKLGSSSTSNVHGVSKPVTLEGVPHGLVYHWRGKGLLMIASSKWEILGHGTDAEGKEYVVTYFGKTLFTPAGLDIYTRTKDALAEATVAEIKMGLKALGSEVLSSIAESMFEIPRT